MICNRLSGVRGLALKLVYVEIIICSVCICHGDEEYHTWLLWR